MARRNSRIDLSLFPFLNILFGLIAVLVLHIFFILQMNGAQGTDMLYAIEGGNQDLRQGLSGRLQQLTQELDDLERQRLQLADEVERRRLLVNLRRRQDLMPAAGKRGAGVPIGAAVPKKWRLVPAAGGGDNLKKPILVEVGATHYVVHDFSGNGHQTRRLPAIPPLPPGERPAQLRAEPELQAFLDQVDRNRRDQYLLFLIRPDGIASFMSIRLYCNEHYPTLAKGVPANAAPEERFDLGYEPFSDQWYLGDQARER
jgi:hypothetical protein